MESVSRVLLIGLLWVSAASAVQYSVERSFERISAMTGTCEGRMEQQAEAASRVIAHRAARLARAGWESDIAALQGSKKLGMAYGY
jgi:hypothetical protein